MRGLLKNRLAMLVFSIAVALVLVALGAIVYYFFWQPSTSESASVAAAGPRSQTITLYFSQVAEGNVVSRTFMLPEHLAFPDQIRNILEKMTEPAKAGEATLAPVALKFRNAFLRKNGLLVLDLDTGVTYNHPHSALREAAMLHSIVVTLLTNYPNLKRIKFLINGLEQDSWQGHVDLTRTYGLEDLKR